MPDNIYRPKGTRIWWYRKQSKKHNNGKPIRKSLGTAKRGLALERAAAFTAELEATAWGERPRRTFDEAALKWQAEFLPTIKQSAALRYNLSLGHLTAFFSGKHIHEITSGPISDFEAKRRADGVLAKKRKDGTRARREIKPSSIRRDIMCLASLLTSCEEWEWIDPPNAATRFLKAKAKRGLKESNARTRYLSAAEETALLAAASDDVADAIAVAIDTGLRREEQFDLRWWQVDLLRGTITTTTKTKSGRARKVPVSDRAAQILSQLPRRKNLDFVFLNLDTNWRFVQRNLGLKAAARRARVQDLRWHDLRRTAGCRWLQRDGKSLEEVSGLLGHSSYAVTEKAYAFLDLDAVAESKFGSTISVKANSGVLKFPQRDQ